jgi:hypothetical protein
LVVETPEDSSDSSSGAEKGETLATDF